jgi:hypothetical protein
VNHSLYNSHKAPQVGSPLNRSQETRRSLMRRTDYVAT